MADKHGVEGYEFNAIDFENTDDSSGFESILIAPEGNNYKRLVSILKYERKDIQTYLEREIGDIIICSTDEEAKTLNMNSKMRTRVKCVHIQ